MEQIPTYQLWWLVSQRVSWITVVPMQNQGKPRNKQFHSIHHQQKEKRKGKRQTLGRLLGTAGLYSLVTLCCSFSLVC